MEIQKYKIFLKASPDETTFSGNVTIFLKNPKKEIILDADRLTVESVQLEEKTIQFSQNIQKNKVHIPLHIKKTELILSVAFHGNVSTNMMGLYVSTAGDGKKILTTQCESIGARMIFPCVDEPSFKAIFSLQVQTTKKYEVIANMPRVEIKEIKDGVVYEFAETPKMSTYLFYLGIGIFTSLSDTYKNIEFTVKSTANHSSEKSKLALQFGKEFLGYLEDYFQIPYPLKKMDLVAIPNFSAAAMENWGAITFREIALLTSDTTSIAIKRRVAEVIAHELVHQWFGNLVTMKWWNDLWLNESFATFVSYKTVNALYPEWNHWNDFITTETAGAMESDSLIHTHPIEANVQDPAEIASMFDNISYGKGGSILRMIESFIGEEHFQKGVQTYLANFAYENAEGKDLWECIEKEAKTSVQSIMTSWIKKSGFPIVKASRSGTKLLLEQEPFKYMQNSVDDSLWPIPITVKNGKTKKEVLFDRKEQSISVDANSFIHINTDAKGFYIVFYDEALRDLIYENKSSLSVYDTYGFLNDMFYLLKAGKIELSAYMTALNHFKDETAYVLVYSITTRLELLNRVIKNKELTLFSKTFFQFHLDRIGLDRSNSEDEDTSTLRGKLASLLVTLDPDYGSVILKKYVSLKGIDPEMRMVFVQAMNNKEGNEDRNLLFDTYINSDNDEEKTIVSYSFFMSSQKDSFIKGLSMLSTNIKMQDRVGNIMVGSFNYAFHALLWAWLKNNIDQLIDDYQGTNYVSKMLESIIPYLGFDMGDVESFFKQKKYIDFHAGVEKGIEKLRVNQRLYELYSEKE